MVYGSWRRFPLPDNWYSEIRPSILARDGVCLWGFLPGELWPGEANCTNASNEVDHIGDPNDHSLDNLRGICTFHHRRRTASQGVEGRARIRQDKPKNRPKPKHPGIRSD